MTRISVNRLDNGRWHAVLWSGDGGEAPIGTAHGSTMSEAVGELVLDFREEINEEGGIESVETDTK